MGLLSFLKRKSADSSQAPAATDAADSVQQARIRARQRLIGAVVLVVAGVVLFSLLLGNPPRPISVDTPIQLARRDGAPGAGRGNAEPSLAVPQTPSARPDEAAVREPATPTSDAPGGEPTPVQTAPAGRPESTQADAQPEPEPRLSPKPTESRPAEPKPVESKPTAAKPASTKPADKPSEASRAQALLDGKEPAASRFVVQIGAFAEAAAARDARQKVEKLGLKTYTQVVETPGGNRIRVRIGPFGSREEADRAVAKIKSAGMPAAVLSL